MGGLRLDLPCGAYLAARFTDGCNACSCMWGFFGLIASIASSGAAVIPFGWAEAQLWQNDSDPSSEWWNFVVLMSGPWWLPWWWDPIAQPLAFWTNPY